MDVILRKGDRGWTPLLLFPSSPKGEQSPPASNYSPPLGVRAWFASLPFRFYGEKAKNRRGFVRKRGIELAYCVGGLRSYGNPPGLDRHVFQPPPRLSGKFHGIKTEAKSLVHSFAYFLPYFPPFRLFCCLSVSIIFRRMWR